MAYITYEPPRTAGTFFQRLRDLAAVFAALVTREGSRSPDTSALLKLSDRHLRDIGMTRNDVAEYLARPHATSGSEAGLYRHSGNW